MNLEHRGAAKNGKINLGIIRIHTWPVLPRGLMRRSGRRCW